MTVATKQRPAQRPGASTTGDPDDFTASPANDQQTITARDAVLQEAFEELLFSPLPDTNIPGWMHREVHRLVDDKTMDPAVRDRHIERMFAKWYRERIAVARDAEDWQNEHLSDVILGRWEWFDEQTGDKRIAAALTVAWASCRGRVR